MNSERRPLSRRKFLEASLKAGGVLAIFHGLVSMTEETPLHQASYPFQLLEAFKRHSTRYTVAGVIMTLTGILIPKPTKIEQISPESELPFPLDHTIHTGQEVCIIAPGYECRRVSCAEDVLGKSRVGTSLAANLVPEVCSGRLCDPRIGKLDIDSNN